MIIKTVGYPQEVEQMLRRVIEGKGSDDESISIFCWQVLNRWDHDRGTSEAEYTVNTSLDNKGNNT
jgi:hypothetical protein